MGLPDLPFPPPVEKPKPFILPERSATNDIVYTYLRGRGIHPEIIRQCINMGILYESRKHGNCVFVGRDTEGVPRYAFLRGTWSDFKCEVAGSAKRYGFMIPHGRKYGDNGILAIYESPVDALSHAAIYPDADIYRLSLGGTSSKALMQFTADYPSVRTVYACLDSDEAGRKGTEKIRAMLPAEYTFYDLPPPEGKDYNHYLQILQRREREITRKAMLSR